MSLWSWIKSKFSKSTVESAKSGPYVDTENHGRVYFPAKGKFVQESHYATNMEKFSHGLFPSSSTEKIDDHIKTSFELLKKQVPNAVFENVYSDRFKREWTPANDGGSNEYGQAARGNVRPAPEEEIWQGNMFFKNLPAIGTKFLITAPNGLKCVIQMGYEIGPGGTTFLGGLTTEVHYYLGTNNDSILTIDTCDQSLPLGPYGTKPKDPSTNDQLKEKAPELKESETPWMDIASKEIGVKETPGSGNNSRVLEYHKSTTLKATEDAVPWCSAFTTWCLERAGYKSTKNAWARSYLNYGKPLNKAQYGCICVFDRGNGSGHVGFFTAETKDMIMVLGGNQSDEVCIKAYPKSKLLGFSWPIK